MMLIFRIMTPLYIFLFVLTVVFHLLQPGAEILTFKYPIRMLTLTHTHSAVLIVLVICLIGVKCVF